MKGHARLQTGEKNKCPHGHGSFEIADVSHDWKCPECGDKLLISALLEGRVRAINRVLPEELSEFDLITNTHDSIHEIIDISPDKLKKGYYRIALRGYRTITENGEDFQRKIMGKWSDD